MKLLRAEEFMLWFEIYVNCVCLSLSSFLCFFHNKSLITSCQRTWTWTKEKRFQVYDDFMFSVRLWKVGGKVFCLKTILAKSRKSFWSSLNDNFGDKDLHETFFFCLFNFYNNTQSTKHHKRQRRRRWNDFVFCVVSKPFR